MNYPCIIFTTRRRLLGAKLSDSTGALFLDPARVFCLQTSYLPPPLEKILRVPMVHSVFSCLFSTP